VPLSLIHSNFSFMCSVKLFLQRLGQCITLISLHYFEFQSAMNIKFPFKAATCSLLSPFELRIHFTTTYYIRPHKVKGTLNLIISLLCYLSSRWSYGMGDTEILTPCSNIRLFCSQNGTLPGQGDPWPCWMLVEISSSRSWIALISCRAASSSKLLSPSKLD
jgi:hypothetical protein